MTNMLYCLQTIQNIVLLIPPFTDWNMVALGRIPIHRFNTGTNHMTKVALFLTLSDLKSGKWQQEKCLIFLNGRRQICVCL